MGERGLQPCLHPPHGQGLPMIPEPLADSCAHGKPEPGREGTPPACGLGASLALALTILLIALSLVGPRPAFPVVMALPQFT